LTRNSSDLDAISNYAFYVEGLLTIITKIINDSLLLQNEDAIDDVINFFISVYSKLPPENNYNDFAVIGIIFSFLGNKMYNKALEVLSKLTIDRDAIGDRHMLLRYAILKLSNQNDLLEKVNIESMEKVSEITNVVLQLQQDLDSIKKR
jgi:hypothetical protein